MSEENVETMRKIVAAADAGDIDVMIALSQPEVEYHSTFALIGGAVYRGHDGLRKWQEELAEVFAGGLRIDPECYYDLGDTVLVFLVLHGKGEQSGAEVTTPVTQAHRFRDGLDVWAKSWVDRDEALKELGVSLDELVPIAPDVAERRSS